MTIIKVNEAIRLEAENKPIENARRVAYEIEADPLFFKMQRGEATQEQWLAKIQEIKQRFPKR